jgi:deazaflavin-dependent oxidoreductase (nitroreductase family)
MHFPRFVRHVNRVFTNPIFRTFAWLVPPLAIVGHVGRRSGRAYRTPVVAFRSGRHVVIPLTYGRDVDWARNLVAGGGDLQQIGRRFRMRNARIVDGAAAAPHLPPLVRQALLAASLPGFVLLDL